MDRFRRWLQTIEARALGEALPEEEQLRRKLLIFASGLMSLGVVVWLAIYWAMGVPFSTTVPMGYQLVTVLSLTYYLYTGKFDVFRFIQLSLFLFFPFAMQWSIGSYVSSSGVMLWALLAPIGATVTQGWRESISWFMAYLVLTALSGFFDYYLATGRSSGIPMNTVAVFFGLNFAAMSVLLYVLFRYFVREREAIQDRLDREHDLLVKEQTKSERLLLNMLPAPIAERLKSGETTIADGHAGVTVMFADIVNFTRLTEQLPPHEMIALLNTAFSSFDQLAEKHRLEKIKTIGDAYMVAGGLTPADGSVDAVADMALELLAILQEDPAFTRYNIGLHIGIATGPVVAGVIGINRFIYDLWGDTVNLASRLTSESMPNTISLDTTTCQRLQGRYAFAGPSAVALKGKGTVPVYRLLNRMSASGRKAVVI